MDCNQRRHSGVAGQSWRWSVYLRCNGWVHGRGLELDYRTCFSVPSGLFCVLQRYGARCLTLLSSEWAFSFTQTFSNVCARGIERRRCTLFVTSNMGILYYSQRYDDTAVVGWRSVHRLNLTLLLLIPLLQVDFSVHGHQTHFVCLFCFLFCFCFCLFQS